MQQNAMAFDAAFGYDFFEAMSSTGIGAHHIEIEIAPSGIAKWRLMQPSPPAPATAERRACAGRDGQQDRNL
jgi:hypothetical protein